MKEIIERIQADPRYQRNIEYGEPRSGHPEGKVRIHITLLETNLELLKPNGISSADYWKLKFLIHVHDTFKAEARHDVPVLHPRSHATLAREYASQFTEDRDLLNMIQFHDEVYFLWREFSETGFYSRERFQTLLCTIQNWDLFLMFVIIDGCTKGKDYKKLTWFIGEVRKYKKTIVDASWILPFGRV
jgi:hypothetical protein